MQLNQGNSFLVVFSSESSKCEVDSKEDYKCPAGSNLSQAPGREAIKQEQSLK